MKISDLLSSSNEEELLLALFLLKQTNFLEFACTLHLHPFRLYALGSIFYEPCVVNKYVLNLSFRSDPTIICLETQDTSTGYISTHLKDLVVQYEKSDLFKNNTENYY